MTSPKPSFLAISYGISDMELAASRRSVVETISERDRIARRDLGAKFIESLEVDHPVTVMLRSISHRSPGSRVHITTLDLYVVPVETMRVVRHEFRPTRPVKSHHPEPAETPGVFGRLWNGWKKHVDQCRESLGG